MTLSDDVYDDLLAVYLAGEASAGTRALIEARARDDAAFAARLEAARTVELPANGGVPGADLELSALRRTRQYIRLRTTFLAAAVLFTLLPLVFAFDSDGIRFLILGHYEGLALAFWSLAVASWAACWTMHRAVRRAGV